MPDSENSCTSGQMSLWGVKEKLFIISETLSLPLRFGMENEHVPGSLIEENLGWKGTEQQWEEVGGGKMRDEPDQLQ